MRLSIVSSAESEMPLRLTRSARPWSECSTEGDVNYTRGEGIKESLSMRW